MLLKYNLHWTNFIFFLSVKVIRLSHLQLLGNMVRKEKIKGVECKSLPGRVTSPRDYMVTLAKFTCDVQDRRLWKTRQVGSIIDYSFLNVTLRLTVSLREVRSLGTPTG